MKQISQNITTCIILSLLIQTTSEYWVQFPLDLAYVASGKLDASMSLANKFSDIAAGILLVKEAGGYILEMNQKDIRTEDLGAVLEFRKFDCGQLQLR